MKILNLKMLMLFIVGSLFFTSCNKNDTVDVTEQISADEAIVLIQADDISDEVNNVIDDYFATEYGLAGRSEVESKTEDILPCVTKIIVLTSTTKTVTLDFGEGCELPNGTILSGKIILTYSLDTDVQQLTISYVFENFYFNDLSVEGENTMVRIRENENRNPQSTLTVNVKVTWPDGEFASREGTKVREFIEGYNTRPFADNVFLITGNWTTTFKNGTILSSTIMEPLRREMACRFIVSGVLELQKGDKVGTLDFGNGSCDDKAILTNEAGEEFKITLRGRMF